jgi:serine/threonine-protein kinase
VYGLAGTLRAVSFDLNRLQVIGTPVPVIEQVAMSGSAANISISDNGSVVYVPGGGAQAGAVRRALVWVDRQGREDPLSAPPLSYRYPRISPDGERVAVEAVVDIWIWDLTRKTQTRFTFDPALDQYPVWTPDGQRLLFRSERNGPHNIYWQAANGTGAVERLTESSNEQAPYSVSPDGTRLVFREDSRETGQDLKILTLRAERRVESLVQTAFNERNGEISPDGRWLAYQSNESGNDEIYVRPFPDVNSGRWQISTGGGRTPLWARSGKELFYQTPNGAVFGVAVEVAGGANFRADTPAKLLVEGRYFVGGGDTSPGRTFDVSRDGQRFLMVKVEPNQAAALLSIVVVQNWFEELKRLVPTN